MRLTPISHAICLMAALVSGLPAPVAAQSQFAPVIYIDNAAITHYEVGQRQRFLALLGGPAATEEAALEALISDRLYQIAARRQKVSATDAEVATGIEEFAARANISAQEFNNRLTQAGIAPQTARDFVKAGLEWRKVVAARFTPKVQITEAQVDRALQIESNRPGLEILLSEIILPMTPEYAPQTMPIRDAIIEQVNDAETFAQAASAVSASASRTRGGALDWMPVTNLPPAILAQIGESGPGSIVGPIDVPNAVAFFLVRGRREAPRPSAAASVVDYAQLVIPGTPAEAKAQAAAIGARVDTCGDLYAEVKGLPANTLVRESRPMGQVPADLSMELARLDINEIGTSLTSNGLTVLTMLCGRSLQVDPPVDREQVRNSLRNQVLSKHADAYLAELRANAIIRRP